MSFIEWLDRELAERGWNDHQLAYHAGISHSVISKARRGTAPRWDACAAIAGALNIPADLVCRLCRMRRLPWWSCACCSPSSRRVTASRWSRLRA
jgi:transcriptional regulator with XRE-family HTH domain